jgi:F-type H+-transporting ATPase subunit c
MEAEKSMVGDIVTAATILGKLIGAGLAMVGVLGGGIGIGVVSGGAVQAMGRNPDATGTIQTNMILGIAFAEATAIYALVVALLILFVF